MKTITAIRKADLLKRGWTHTMIRDYCLPPHILAKTGYGDDLHLYDLERIEQIEQADAWKSRKSALDARREKRTEKERQEVAAERIRLEPIVAAWQVSLPAASTREQLIAICKVPQEAKVPDRVCVKRLH